MGCRHWGNPADPTGQQQGRYPKATGLSPGRLHQGPWKTLPRAMEATGDRRAGTQSGRGRLPSREAPQLELQG